VHIALIGTRGVPARYGGFETCVEEVGSRLAARGHHVTVYCRRPLDGPPPPDSYLGMELVTLPAMRRRSLETLSHSAASVADAVLRRRPDVAVVFNSANAPLLPLLRASQVPVATHVDGLEWKRAKWGRLGRHYYQMAEGLAVRWSDALIADAPGIARYYDQQFGAATVQIAYGAPVVRIDPWALEGTGLRPRRFHLVVARFEPENHVEEIVRGYAASSAELPLVVVGGAPYNDRYVRAVHDAGDERVRFLGSVWDQHLLDQLYANALVYWHGHSVGGTNPSLLRALGAGAATNAFDVDFNRDVLEEAGRYWSDPSDVARLVESAEREPSALDGRRRAAARRAAHFDWGHVADEYETLCVELLERASVRSVAAARPGAIVSRP
jgi:glycosyltransferase involved in cell wall biosynthesis